ncbi:MAG: hypothetical protein NTZ56_07775 [Acidobacteria bacterium]|nr:hypothetical protein [Acidobacteriota bacterium]
MIEWPDPLPARSVIVDANVLLLLVVGRADPDRIARFKRTANQGFSSLHYNVLNALLKESAQIVATPNLLTETSNLLPSELHDQLRQLVDELIELYVPSRRVTAEDWFDHLGLADASIIDAAANTASTVITVDVALLNQLVWLGLPVANFHQVVAAVSA